MNDDDVPTYWAYNYDFAVPEVKFHDAENATHQFQHAVHTKLLEAA